MMDDPATDNPTLVGEQSSDAQFLEAVENMRTANRPRVRVRVLLQLYQFGKSQRYKNWRGLNRLLELQPTVMAASNFLTAHSVFLDAVTKIGPAKVVDALQNALKETNG